MNTKKQSVVRDFYRQHLFFLCLPGDSHLDNEDVAALELSRRYVSNSHTETFKTNLSYFLVKNKYLYLHHPANPVLSFMFST